MRPASWAIITIEELTYTQGTQVPRHSYIKIYTMHSIPVAKAPRCLSHIQQYNLMSASKSVHNLGYSATPYGEHSKPQQEVASI